MDNSNKFPIFAPIHIQQMELEDTETMSIEEAREMTLAAVREEYARP